MICDSDELFDRAIPSLILPSTPSRDLPRVRLLGGGLEQGKNGKQNRNLEKNLRQSPVAGKPQVAQKFNFRANWTTRVLFTVALITPKWKARKCPRCSDSGPDQPRFSRSTLKMRLCIVRRPLVASLTPD